MSLIVVQYFYDLPALSLAKRQLETEGIKAIVRDELATQMGGEIGVSSARLLVKQKDYTKASQILIEGGFINANDNPQDFWIVDFLVALAQPIPFVNKLSKELRLVMICFILVSIPFGLALLLSL